MRKQDLTPALVIAWFEEYKDQKMDGVKLLDTFHAERKRRAEKADTAALCGLDSCGLSSCGLSSCGLGSCGLGICGILTLLGITIAAETGTAFCGAGVLGLNKERYLPIGLLAGLMAFLPGLCVQLPSWWSVVNDNDDRQEMTDKSAALAISIVAWFIAWRAHDPDVEFADLVSVYIAGKVVTTCIVVAVVCSGVVGYLGYEAYNSADSEEPLQQRQHALFRRMHTFAEGDSIPMGEVSVSEYIDFIQAILVPVQNASQDHSGSLRVSQVREMLDEVASELDKYEKKQEFVLWLSNRNDITLSSSCGLMKGPGHDPLSGGVGGGGEPDGAKDIGPSMAVPTRRYSEVIRMGL